MDYSVVKGSENFKTFEKKLTYYFQRHGILDILNKTDRIDEEIGKDGKIDSRIAENFFKLYCGIVSENEKYNLTSIVDEDEVILKHFVDSVMILKYIDIPFSSKIVDIGTGAGFPSLPIYIMRNDLRITFLDSSAKKINFIRDMVQMLGISDIQGNLPVYLCGRAENASREKDFRESYDFAVSRAVAKLSVLCELAVPLVKVDGRFIPYKGRNADSEIDEAGSAMSILGIEVAAVHKFDIAKVNSPATTDEDDKNRSKDKDKDRDGDGNRRVLIDIKKTKHTPQLYPRNFAKIIKNPL